jgi:hypothetical protein
MELYVLVVKIQDVFIISAFSRKKVRKMNKKKSDRRKKNNNRRLKGDRKIFEERKHTHMENT